MKKAENKCHSEAADLTRFFAYKFRSYVGEGYTPTWGRDIKIFGELVSTYGPGRVRELVELYFKTPRKLYSVPFFKTEINNLLQQCPKSKAKMVNHDGDRFK